MAQKGGLAGNSEIDTRTCDLRRWIRVRTRNANWCTFNNGLTASIKAHSSDEQDEEDDREQDDTCSSILILFLIVILFLFLLHQDSPWPSAEGSGVNECGSGAMVSRTG